MTQTADYLAQAGAIRFSVFAGMVALMVLWELRWPRRQRVVPRSRYTRWPANFGVTLLNGALAGGLIPLGAIGVALLAQRQGWGLFNLLPIPAWLSFVLSIILLDLAIYLQHLVLHAVPLLWRIHRMHHADLDLDVSSGGRFHTLEILLSVLIKMAVVLALGAPALAVLAFEVLLNATSMFNHSNVYLPSAVDRVLRGLLVTPDMHRVHHSIELRETNSNYGFNLSWWDRLFGTYRAQPARGHDGMVIGIEQFHRVRDQRFDRMWLIPFRNDAEDSE